MSSLRTRTVRSLLIAGVAIGALTGCAVVSASTPTATSSTAAAASEADAASSLWDSSSVHDISVDYEQSEYDAAIAEYLDSGEKVWISATVTIDGDTFENVGLKLKGNSSLRSLSASDDAADLPWIIRLDKYVDGQNLDGTTELVVRGNSSQTSLNEALALDLLDASGLAAEQAVAVRFSAGGSEPTLRLVVENPGDEWAERELGDVLLYKAEAGGDYSYRGDEEAAYTDVFDQEAGEDDLTPLIGFLEWINESDDETFAVELDEHLDVDAFATYLAFQEVVDNFDDIDGPGNNSYLSYDPTTGLMTVVTWDLNLAFGASPTGGGGGRAGGGGGERPDQPRDAETTDAGSTDAAGTAGTQDVAVRGGGGPGGSNILAERFLAVDAFADLYESEITRLRAELIESGEAASLLDAWSEVLSSQASDLVSAATITEEAEALAGKLDG
ncbi:CotH kinase family protein [Microbacterium sp. LjRoot45]|uniref:CotH kinase family protein n=1 Tax=Microbacterium sp. LjRoot45 TaxID=3342329 RepID=UPI003ECF5695